MVLPDNMYLRVIASDSHHNIFDFSQFLGGFGNPKFLVLVVTLGGDGELWSFIWCFHLQDFSVVFLKKKKSVGLHRYRQLCV